MSTTGTQKKARWCWRKDLAAFRGLSDRERTGFLLVLEWFENFRLRHELSAGRDAAKSFWRCEVLGKDRQRETWQIEQWQDAIKWYLGWLDACAEEGGDHRSLRERVRAAVNSACSRRGHAPRTKDTYARWAARYAGFAGDEHEIMREETATRFLTSVVDDEDCAYSTQKQALNALAFLLIRGLRQPPHPSGAALRSVQNASGPRRFSGNPRPRRHLRLQCSRTSPPSGSLKAGCLGAHLGSTTEIYLHVATGVHGLGVVSPLDGLAA